MRTSYVISVTAAVAVTVSAAGCSAGPTTISASPSAHQSSSGDAPARLADASSAMRNTTAAHVQFSSTGVDDLTASSYDADVSVAPPAAHGSANLLIDGQRVQTGFKVADGQLWVETVDGGVAEAGAAHGQLDPPALIDRATGLAALIGAVHDAVPVETTDADPAAVKLEAKLPVRAALLLVPRSSLGVGASLPVTLWLDPAENNALAQLVVGIGDGSVSLHISAAQRTNEEPSTGRPRFVELPRSSRGTPTPNLLHMW